MLFPRGGGETLFPRESRSEKREKRRDAFILAEKSGCPAVILENAAQQRGCRQQQFRRFPAELVACGVGELQTAHECVHNRGSYSNGHCAIAGEMAHGANAEGGQGVTQTGDADREPVRQHVTTQPGQTPATTAETAGERAFRHHELLRRVGGCRGTLELMMPECHVEVGRGEATVRLAIDTGHVDSVGNGEK